MIKPKPTITGNVKPLKPLDVLAAKAEAIPDQVIEAFNHLIAENFRNSTSTFKLKEVKQEAAKRMGLEDTSQLKSTWFDVEDIYRKQGWKVEYDRPGYNETYDAYFRFTTPRYRNGGVLSRGGSDA